MPAPTLTRQALNRATLARQLLLSRSPLPAQAATEHLVALQAQWPKLPFIGLWSRLAAFRREDLTTLVQERSLVRATLVRATIHLTGARDYLHWRPLLQPGFTASLQRFGARGQGIDAEQLVRVARDFYTDRPRTFAELREHLTLRFPDLDERIMGHTVRLSMPLVQVPTESAWGWPATTDWAMAETWLGRPLATGDDQLQDLILRYLSAFGPATPKDMQTWSGLPALKAAFEALRPRLVTFRNEQGKELFDLPDAPRPDPETPAPVRFLPEFDNVVIGHDDRLRFVAADDRKRLILPGLRVPSTFLVDGFVAGTWTVDSRKRQATLRIEPFRRLPKQAIPDLTDEGERLVRFIEPEAETVEVVVAPV
jgi:hypothetical protein